MYRQWYSFLLNSQLAICHPNFHPPGRKWIQKVVLFLNKMGPKTKCKWGEMGVFPYTWPKINELPSGYFILLLGGPFWGSSSRLVALRKNPLPKGQGTVPNSPASLPESQLRSEVLQVFPTVQLFRGGSLNEGNDLVRTIPPTSFSTLTRILSKLVVESGQ